MLDIKEIGIVEDIRKSIVTVRGFLKCMSGQLVDFKEGGKGIVMSFVDDKSFVLALTEKESVEPKDTVISRARNFMIPVGENFLGRIINSLGEPLDKKGSVGSKNFYPVFKDVACVLDREPLSETLETGILVVDSVIPIAKGQKELIIGDRVTGKTTIAQDIILNQRDKDVICIYCSIGKSTFDLSKTVQLFEDRDVFKYSIIVAATASSSVGEQYLAPYTASALGEYFMYQGKDVVVVFDDLTKHGWAYREISLLLERSPGREAYPGDIFYIHAQLLERAGKLRKELGSGSMTFFPIIETQEGDITGYIPSNLISMTDGQIYLSSSLFSEGFRPAVDLKLSVSRIGSKAQFPAMRSLTERLRLEYLQYLEFVRLTKMKTVISKEMEEKIERGEAITCLFIQDKNTPFSTAEEIILLYALRKGLLDEVMAPAFARFKTEIFNFISQEVPELMSKIASKKELSPEIEMELNHALDKFKIRQDSSLQAGWVK